MEYNIPIGGIIYRSIHFKALTQHNNPLSNTAKMANSRLLNHNKTPCMHDPPLLPQSAVIFKTVIAYNTTHFLTNHLFCEQEILDKSGLVTYLTCLL